MLAFWWYASTCRHLGIGGVSDPTLPLYQALKQSVSTYQSMKPFFKQGDFQGLDVLSHLHVLQDRNQAVALLFNLGSTPEERTIVLDLARHAGLDSVDSVDGASLEIGSDGIAHLTTMIEPLSPKLVKINLT
jgi:hypothetical protein